MTGGAQLYNLSHGSRSLGFRDQLVHAGVQRQECVIAHRNLCSIDQAKPDHLFVIVPPAFGRRFEPNRQFSHFASPTCNGHTSWRSRQADSVISVTGAD